MSVGKLQTASVQGTDLSFNECKDLAKTLGLTTAQKSLPELAADINNYANENPDKAVAAGLTASNGDKKGKKAAAPKKVAVPKAEKPAKVVKEKKVKEPKVKKEAVPFNTEVEVGCTVEFKPFGSDEKEKGEVVYLWEYKDGKMYAKIRVFDDKGETYVDKVKQAGVGILKVTKKAKKEKE